MRIESPIGAYDYRVERVRFARRGLEVTGSLGEWETTTVVEPADLGAAARRAAPLVGLVVVGVLVRRALAR